MRTDPPIGVCFYRSVDHFNDVDAPTFAVREYSDGTRELRYGRMSEPHMQATVRLPPTWDEIVFDVPLALPIAPDEPAREMTCSYTAWFGPPFSHDEPAREIKHAYGSANPEPPASTCTAIVPFRHDPWLLGFGKPKWPTIADEAEVAQLAKKLAETQVGEEDWEMVGSELD